jgi:hypothetical protein
MTVYSQPNAPMFLRGKVNWFSPENIKVDAPSYLHLFKQKPDPESLEKLAKHLVQFLKKKGFVFFDDYYYRYRINTAGHLKEIGLNFRYIQ